MDRYQISYDVNLMNPMDLFERLSQIKDLTPYHHNVTNGVIGTQIGSNSLNSARNLSGIVDFSED